MTENLTHSAMSAARRCFMSYHYTYELGLVRDAEAKALRMGSAVHAGLAAWSRGSCDYVTVATADYATLPI